MKFVVGEKKKVLWEVADNRVVEETTDHEEIVLLGFDFNFFDEDEKGVGREGSSEFTYLLMLINILPGNWKTQLKSINHKVDEGSEKALGKGDVRYRNFCRFSRNGFWKNIGCLVLAPNFGIGGSRLLEKEGYVNIIEKKSKRFNFQTILTPFFFAIFLVSLSLGDRFQKVLTKRI